MFKTATVDATICLIHSAALAETSDPTFMNGIMMAECSTITAGIPEQIDPKTDVLASTAMGWAAGYMTSVNISLMAEGEPMYILNSKSAHELWRDIYGYCKVNPKQLGLQAVSTVMATLPRAPKK